MEYGRTSQPEGVGLLAAILICYREISTISFEPRDRTVKLTFTVNKEMDENSFHDIVTFLDESIHTYHMIAGVPFTPIEFTMETQGEYAFLHIIRDIETLTNGELTVITTIVRERIGDNLIVGDNPVDEEIMEMQEEHLENMFLTIRTSQMRNRLVGVREGDSVMVYDK